jgi:glyoxylase-like metal-dependent hydrolase (beta-lactamase superfamily II)
VPIHVSETAPGVHRLVLPLGVHGLDTVNCWVLAGGDGLTLVDPGVHRPEPEHDHGLAQIDAGLRTLGRTLRDVRRVLVTHAHIDHYGMAGRLLAETGAQLLMHAATDLDCEKYRHPDTAVARRRDLLTDHGMTGTDRETVASGLRDWLPYLHSVVEAGVRLRGGERLDGGSREWEVVHTPGHSAGHVCLWSGTDGLLLSGDHLLPGVSPPVTFERGFDENPLASYLRSLEAVRDLGPELVLPGHGRPFRDVARRISAIAYGKTRRVERIFDALAARPQSVTELTALIRAEMLGYQQHLAIAETLANLAYLRHQGRVERRIRASGDYEWCAVEAAG